jgi:hypothetical protein
LHIPLAYDFNDAQRMKNDDFYIKSWGGQEMVMSPNYIICTNMAHFSSLGGDHPACILTFHSTHPLG